MARTDSTKLAALKKDLDANGAADLPDVPLDNFDLRLIVFGE